MDKEHSKSYQCFLIRNRSLILWIAITTSVWLFFIQATTAYSSESSSRPTPSLSDNPVAVGGITKLEVEHSADEVADGPKSGSKRTDKDTDAFEDAPGDELLLFEDMPVVISAARRAPNP